jgi:hypothetical protein
MSNRDKKLGANEGRSDRRINVTIHNHEIWLAFRHGGFEANHDLRGLLCLASGTHSEVQVGPWQLQLLEENVGHVAVIVLASVNQSLPIAVLTVHSTNDSCCLHEIRSSTDNVKYVHKRSGYAGVSIVTY